jgi:hypothetical protein
MNTGQDAPFTGSQDGRRYVVARFLKFVANFKSMTILSKRVFTRPTT